MVSQKGQLNKLIGRRLVAVTFILDYIQLQFDSARLNAFVWPAVIRKGEKIAVQDTGYKDAICELIEAAVVSAFVEDGCQIVIVFENSMIKISLREEDAVGAEAALLFFDGEPGFSVW